MGNESSSCDSQATSCHLEELCGLTTRNYDSSSQLSFDTGDYTCSSDFSQHSNKRWENSIESSGKGEAHDLEAQPEEVVECLGKAQLVQESCHEVMTLLQKNQRENDKIPKNKPIKKAKHPKKVKPAAIAPAKDVMMNPEEGDNLSASTTVVEEGIRDQNNCKSYHKLVKNYLAEKGLVNLFDGYDVEYHTRYYFTVALIFVKYYLNDDFNEVYKRIARKEIDAQTMKIQRKQTQKDKLSKELSSGPSLKVEKELLQKITQLDSKMNHIRVVIHEIDNFSVRSCQAFFEGNTEESLRILYLKDDPVMRKKYYFDSALALVTKIQNQVRKTTSQRT